jgi:2',3'-cyclic-nucleotide 2'-phosphodiesterase (5'-nucleotidase family)
MPITPKNPLAGTLAALALAALLGGCATKPPAPVQLRVLAINDFHGNLKPARGGEGAGQRVLRSDRHREALLATIRSTAPA